MCSAQGRSVSRPYSSWLNQFPQRPMACARAMPGARASAQAGRGMPRRRQPIHAPTAPNAMAPQIPRPPSQILKASTQFSPSLKYSW
jgi:hypothetical protein